MRPRPPHTQFKSCSTFAAVCTGLPVPATSPPPGQVQRPYFSSLPLASPLWSQEKQTDFYLGLLVLLKSCADNTAHAGERACLPSSLAVSS